VLRQSTRT